MNKKTQAAADMIKESYGSFVECDFLSDDFINMVVADHQIQILHNVAVCPLCCRDNYICCASSL